MAIDREDARAKARAAAETARSVARGGADARRAEAKAAVSRARRPPVVELPEPTGDLEHDTAANLGAVEAGFRARAKAEADRFRLATDSEYWTCLCFQSRAQKEAFLASLNLLQHGDKYIDGRVVAQQLGIALPAADVPFNTSAKIDPTWAAFTEQED